MIELEKSISGELNGFPIDHWEVWFLTMKGYHKTLADALKHAEEIEMPPELIRPVPVAISVNNEWEPVHK
jgi:hypothetical protein